MWKRRFLTPEDNTPKVVYNQQSCVYHSELYQSSPVDEFYVEQIKTADGKETSFHVDPLIMLFNQDRLNELGSMGVKEFLDSLQQRDDSLKDLRSKCSDEQLIQLMKSRYLQTPSEIISYCRYIEGNIDAFNKEVHKFVEQQKQQVQQTSVSNVESQTSE